MTEEERDTTTPRSMPAKICGILGYLLFLILCTFLLLEIAIRIVLPQPVPPLWLEADAEYGHRLKRDFQQDFPFQDTDYVMHVQTNADGFRDEPFTGVNPDEKRILFLGDSYTFGFGVDVDERFDRLLAVQFKEDGHWVTPINCGVNGWGTIQATRYGVSQLERYRPDAVVLTFCENDVRDDTNFLAHGFSFDQVHFPGKGFLNQHSHLFRLGIKQYLLRKKAQSDFVTDNQAGMDNTEVKTELWERSFAQFMVLADALREQNPNATVYIQATRPADSFYKKEFKALGYPGLVYVDLEPHIQDLPPEERRLSYDGHWSRPMHEKSAAVLGQVVKL